MSLARGTSQDASSLEVSSDISICGILRSTLAADRASRRGEKTAPEQGGIY